MNKIPTAAYIRVSTQEQKMHGISLDAQRDKLTEYANAHDLNIIAWYEDEGVSGRKLIKNRPQLQRMIKDAQTGAFSHIIFIKLDRFFRSVAEYHDAMKQLGDTTWTATEEKYDLTTANGRAFVNMKLTIAELEADQTGERIRLVNEYKAKTGQPLTGSVPWSHKIIKTENGKRVIVNDETREQCIAVIDYFIRCQSLRRTLNYCAQYHSFYDIKGLKKWLKSPLLMGQYRDNPNYCEPLITAEKFELLQAKMPNNLRESQKGVTLFSRLLVCPDCGRKLNGVSWSQVIKGKRYRYKRYRCDNNVKNHGCPNNKVLTERPVETALLNALEKYVQEQNREYTIKEKPAPRVNVDALKAQLDRLNVMFERGRITLEEYDNKYNNILADIENAKCEPVEDVSDKVKKLNEIIKDGWRAIYDELDREHRRDFWHMVLKSAEIRKDGRNYEVIRLELN